MINRVQLIDVLKGISVLLMIQVHIIELFATDTIFNSYLGKILLFVGGPPVAPLFVMIMGYFLAATKKTTAELIKRGLSIFCLGMLLNIALNFNLIISVYKGLLTNNLLPYIFGIDILQFAGMAIIIIAVFKHILQKNVWLTLISSVILAAFGNLFLNTIPPNSILKYSSALLYGSTSWSYFPLLPWLAYPLVGFSFYQLQQKYTLTALMRTKTTLLFVLLFSCFIVFTGKYAITVSANLQAYYHHGVLFFLWVIIFLAFYVYFLNLTTNLIANNSIVYYLKWLGKHVTLIYVIQWLIIGNIATQIYKTISSPIHLLICFFVIIFVSSGLTYFGLLLRAKYKK